MTRQISGQTLDRRKFMVGAGTVALVISGAAVMHPGEAWGLEVKNLKPETMRTLIKLGRDIYPHDRVADRVYAVAMKTYDEKSGTDAATKQLVEKGVAEIDELAQKKHGVPYAAVGWEAERVKLLHQVEDGAFFQKVKGDMLVSLYNQKEVWPLFGYEGESASKGGYIKRGFDDITWL